jgi:hypothetical protein
MSDRVTELLLKAVRLLSQQEQDEVLTGLLAGIAQSHTEHPLAHLSWAVPPASSRVEIVERLTHGERSGTPGGASSDLKVLPVRLPGSDYDRLREWSRAHGFSMAVIIRTLVERFIEDQERRAAPQNPPGASG